ncbi:hypothetical protein SH611_11790 [Geminicoccaceae bacterium 1502E]|nr:hypothetical protein [Geminicoccaceae bacterium 1502E]
MPSHEETGNLDECLAGVARELERWAHLGNEAPEPGGRLIAHLPHKAPLFWMHRLYPALDEERIAALEEELEREVPGSFRDLLLRMNGARLFCPFLNIFGGDTSRRRDPTYVMGEPISLRYGNVIERARNLPSVAFCIGSMVGNAIACRYYLFGDGTVRLVRQHDASHVAAEWPDIQTMLLAETQRLGTLHDAEGETLVEAHEIWPDAAKSWDRPSEPRRSPFRRLLDRLGR